MSVTAVCASASTEQSLDNSLPNTPYYQVLTELPGRRTREPNYLRYAVNGGLLGSNPA